MVVFGLDKCIDRYWNQVAEDVEHCSLNNVVYDPEPWICFACKASGGSLTKTAEVSQLIQLQKND